MIPSACVHGPYDHDHMRMAHDGSCIIVVCVGVIGAQPGVSVVGDFCSCIYPNNCVLLQYLKNVHQN